MNKSFHRIGILRPASIVLGLLMANGGCAKLYHEFHYSPVGRQLAQHQATYYQSPHTGRIIPKDPCMQYGEPPCFGYEPTCWQPWPSECVNCPPPPVTTPVYHGGQSVAGTAAKPVVGEALPPSTSSQPTPANVSPTAAQPALITAEPIDSGSIPPQSAESAVTPASATPDQAVSEPPAAAPSEIPPAAPSADIVDEPQVSPPPAGAAPGSSGIDFPNPNQGTSAPSRPFFDVPQAMTEPVRIPQPTLVDPAPERTEAMHETPEAVTDPPAEEPRPERSSRRPTEHRLAGPTRVELPRIEALTAPQTKPTSESQATSNESQQVTGSAEPTAPAQASAEPQQVEAPTAAPSSPVASAESVVSVESKIEFPPALQESSASRLLRQAISQSGAIPVGPTARVIRVEPKPEPAATVASDEADSKTSVVAAEVAGEPVVEGEPVAATPVAVAAPVESESGTTAVAASQTGKADIRFLGDSSPAVIKPAGAGPRLRLGGVPRQASRPTPLELKFRN